MLLVHVLGVSFVRVSSSLVHLGRTDQSFGVGALLGGNPPGLSEVLQPHLLVTRVLEDGIESGALGPAGAVAVTSRVRLLATAASVSELASSGSDISTAVRVVLAVAHDAVVEEGTGLGPSATLSVGRVEEHALVLKLSALSVVLTGSDALGVLEVVVVSEAEVTVEHHLEVRRVLSLVDSLPLVLGRVATDSEARTPALEQQGLVEVVVEDALVGGITPVALVATVLLLGRAEGMSTGQSSNVSPNHAGVLDVSEEVATEDISEIVAALLGIRHEASGGALVGGNATELESVAQGRRHGHVGEQVLGAVVAAVGADHGSLGGNNNEVSERHILAPLRVNRLNSGSSNAAGETGIVSIGEVDAAVGTTSAAVTSSVKTEVHEVMTGKSDEASGIFTNVVVLVELVDNGSDEVFVVVHGHVGSLVDGSGGAREDLRRILGCRLQLSVVSLFVDFTIGIFLKIKTEGAFGGNSSYESCDL